MARVAVCIFLIAILYTGIITSSQANETSTVGVSINDEKTTTKPTEVKAKESQAPSIVETQSNSEVSSDTESKDEEAGDVTDKKDGTPTEEKEAKLNESKKENVTQKSTAGENRKLLPDLSKGTPFEQTKVLFEFPKNIFGPVNDVGVKIGEAFSKGMDTAKDFADGTYSFLRTSAKNLFE